MQTSRSLRVLTIGHSYVVGLNRAVMARVARHPEIDLTVAAPRFFQGDLRPLYLEETDEPSYRLVASDHFWYWLYLPIAHLVESGSRLVGRLQQGRISTYLMASFITLLVMLVLVFR